jgi:hypothetical protein
MSALLAMLLAVLTACGSSGSNSTRILSATAAWIDLSMVRLILKRLAHEQRKPFV